MELKIDIAYKLGSNSDWGNYEELRYSLRSIEKNLGDHLGKVFVVGSKPDWLINVYYRKIGDPYRRNKDANLINKLIVASSSPTISDHFLNMSDDYFLLKPIGGNEAFLNTAYFDNDVPMKGDKLNRWNKRLRRTFEALEKLGYKQDCYETHCPQVLHKKHFPDTVLKFPFGEDIGMCGNTLYFNAYTGEELIKQQVPKGYVSRVISKSTPIDKGCTWLNSTARGITGELKSFLKEQFPDKSSFEK